jgi:predicted secreted protein
MRHVFAFCLTLFFISECLAAGGPPIIVTKADNGRQITVRSGEAFQVRLEAPGGTGFLWKADPVDADYLEIVTEETTGSREADRTGGTVCTIWTIMAKKPGSANIIMRYYRPWEGRDKAADTFSVNLKIL